MPGKQDGGGEQSSAVNRSRESMLNGDKGEHRQIAFTGYFSTIVSHSEAYPKDTKAEIVLLPSLFDPRIQISTRLDKLIEILRKVNSNQLMRLTLLPSDIHNNSNKRRRIDGNPQSSAQHAQENGTTTEVKKIDSNLCGNCGGSDHKAAFCVKVGKSGWMEACCKCDSLQHTYEHCPCRRRDEDFQYLIINRGNKAPVKCSLSLGLIIALELDRDNSRYQDTDIIALPYSSRFSRGLALSQDEACEDKLVDDGGKEIKDDAGNLIELFRHNEPLCRSASNLKHQRWTVDEDKADLIGKRCENCYSHGHSIYHCDKDCGFCGSSEHLTFFCDDRDKACSCRKYPGHNRFECQCWYCERQDNQLHDIGSCPSICHYCLKSDHVTKKCEAVIAATSRVCPRCPKESYHYPSMHMVCAGEGCTRLIHSSPCKEHCLNCG
ncbi:hypothetical protein F4678DRAFT_415211 [Xylaria arbuscula]|nr:hypothetical protein F4678DRAFT_415211 [Xylaria arbuscula]